MSLILSISVLAFVAYDFVLLMRMRKAVNSAIEATAALEAMLRERPTKSGEIVVDLKIDTSEVIRDLTNRIAQAQKAGPEDTRPFGIGPDGMVGPRGTVFEPLTAQFVDPPPHDPPGPEGVR